MRRFGRHERLDLMQVIDVHSHVVPPGIPPLRSDCVCPWPSVQQEGSQATLMVGGRPYRQIDQRCWDVSSRLAAMDEDGVAMQVISPMPELLSHWFPTEAAAEMARLVNDTIADMVRQAPDRLAGLGMVPMQDPPSAVRMLRDIAALGLRGIETGSNIGGVSPADPRFDPIWAEAERLGLCVFVHAVRPVGADRLLGKGLEPLIAFPLDTALAAAGFITTDAAGRFPALRLGFSHGGGALASILPRLAFGREAHGAMQAAFPDPVEAARGFFYDSLVYDPRTLRHLIATFGADRIMAGTDFPFTIRQPRLAAWLEGAGLAEDELRAIASGTALRFLGLTPD
jgi:aminocarboxymuconate-semialdehyde decarboxylase